jgi:hypothetical protein
MSRIEHPLGGEKTPRPGCGKARPSFPSRRIPPKVPNVTDPASLMYVSTSNREVWTKYARGSKSRPQYLCESGTSMAPYKPWLYPQGSANLGLTVKPDYDNEFDFDVICQLILANRPTQEAFVNILFERLKQRGIYTLRRMNRCVRVQYANEFHIDITPAIPDDILGPQNIKVTDKEVGRWKDSNPRDSATWFKAIAQVIPRIIYADKVFMEAYAAVEPLPTPTLSRPLLNRIIQLLKCHRDIMFKGDKTAPISAIITTLAAKSYAHHAVREHVSMVHFIQQVVTDMPYFITKAEAEESVPNPANPFENYADKWRTKPERQKAFHVWHGAAIEHFNSLLKSLNLGKQKLFENLSAAYGEKNVKWAVTAVAEARRMLTESRQLGVSKTTGFVAPLVGTYQVGQNVLPVKDHTNFGC